MEIKGKSRIQIELKRHLAPKTVGILLRCLPLDGNAHFLGKGIIYFESAIDSGIERARSDFKKGDIAFSPAQASLCFFTHDVSLGKKLSLIGKITSNVDELNCVKSGDVLSLYQETG